MKQYFILQEIFIGTMLKKNSPSCLENLIIVAKEAGADPKDLVEVYCALLVISVNLATLANYVRIAQGGKFKAKDFQQTNSHSLYVKALASSKDSKRLQSYYAMSLTLGSLNATNTFAPDISSHLSENLDKLLNDKGPANTKVSPTRGPDALLMHQRGLMNSLRGKWTTAPVYRSSEICKGIGLKEVKIESLTAYFDMLSGLSIKVENPVVKEALSSIDSAAIGNRVITILSEVGTSFMEEESDYIVLDDNFVLSNLENNLTPIESSLSWIQRRVAEKGDMVPLQDGFFANSELGNLASLSKRKISGAQKVVERKQIDKVGQNRGNPLKQIATDVANQFNKSIKPPRKDTTGGK